MLDPLHTQSTNEINLNVSTEKKRRDILKGLFIRCAVQACARMASLCNVYHEQQQQQNITHQLVTNRRWLGAQPHDMNHKTMVICISSCILVCRRIVLNGYMMHSNQHVVQMAKKLTVL